MPSYLNKLAEESIHDHHPCIKISEHGYTIINKIAITLIATLNSIFVVIGVVGYFLDTKAIWFKISLYLNSLPDLVSVILMFIALYSIKKLHMQADLKVMTLHAVILFLMVTLIIVGDVFNEATVFFDWDKCVVGGE